MPTLDEARRLILERAGTLGTETVELVDSLGLVTAEDIASPGTCHFAATRRWMGLRFAWPTTGAVNNCRSPDLFRQARRQTIESSLAAQSGS